MAAARPKLKPSDRVEAIKQQFPFLLSEKLIGSAEKPFPTEQAFCHTLMQARGKKWWNFTVYVRDGKIVRIEKETEGEVP